MKQCSICAYRFEREFFISARGKELKTCKNCRDRQVQYKNRKIIQRRIEKDYQLSEQEIEELEEKLRSEARTGRPYEDGESWAKDRYENVKGIEHYDSYPNTWDSITNYG